MRKSPEFDNILNECLERVLLGGETVDRCLESHPQQAEELKPLLDTVLAASLASAIQPRPEFRARARYDFLSALRATEPGKRRAFLGWQPAWATAIAAILVLLLAGGGTAAAASGSMPDEPLYPVKLATEQVRLALTPSGLGKAGLSAQLADKRVTEIARMAEQGKPEQIERVTQLLDAELTRMVTLAGGQPEESSVLMAPAPAAEAPTAPGLARGNGQGPSAPETRRAKLRALVARYAASDPAVLRAALETAPESAKPALRRAIAISEAAYDKALKTLE